MLRLLATATLTIITTIWSAGSAAGQSLTSLTLDSASVTGGNALMATVSLNAPAPLGVKRLGVRIFLSSSAPLAATVPSSVRIPLGADSATFEIKTNPVAANPNVIPPGFKVEIAARGPGGPDRWVTLRATLRVLPPFVKSIGFISPVYGGDSAFGLVILTGRAPKGGVRVFLSSADPTLASVLESVPVNAGAVAALVTAGTNGVTQLTPVDISASRGPFNIQTATLQLLPAALEQLEIIPDSVINGMTAPGRVLLLGKVAAGSAIQVGLSSTNSAIATPQPSLLSISGGANTAPFTVVTHNVGSVTIFGSYGGVMKQDTLAVSPPTLNSLTLAPGTVFGGAISHGTVTLNGTAPSGGANVSLSKTYNTCPSTQTPTVPSTTTVVGNGSGTFDVQTFAIATQCQVRIRAQYLDSCLQATLTVKPQNPGSQPAAVGTPCP